MLGSMFLVYGCVLASEMGSDLCVKSNVKVLQWEKGREERKKAKGREKGGKEGRGEVKMCGEEREKNNEKGGPPKEMCFRR